MISRSQYGFLPLDVNGFESLEELALDLRWSWNHAADELWRQFDPVLWESIRNPWLILQTVALDQLETMLLDQEFRKNLQVLV
jgi:starch phosphorylase